MLPLCDYGKVVGKAAEDDDRCFVRVAGAGPFSTTSSDKLPVRSSRTAIELWSDWEWDGRPSSVLSYGVCHSLGEPDWVIFLMETAPSQF